MRSSSRFEYFRRCDECASVGDELGDGAEGSGPVDPLAIGGGVCLGHQVDPLVTRGGAEAAWGGVDGGLMAFAELEAPAPRPGPGCPRAPVELVVTVLEPAWCPGSALAT